MSLIEKDNITSELIWNDELEIVYGEKGKFIEKDEFINRVKAEFLDLTGLQASIYDVKTESCICTKDGLPGDCIVPLSETDFEIKTFFIAQVVYEETT